MVGRATYAQQHARMLYAAIGIEQKRTDRSCFRPLSQAGHFDQPFSCNDLGIVVQENQNVANCRFTRIVIDLREIEGTWQR